MNKLSDWLSGRAIQQGFWRSVGVLAGGTAFAQGLIMLSSPFLTRLYSPADLGALAVFMSAVSILSTIASLRYEVTIPLPEDDETAANLLAVALALVFCTSVACGVILWIVGDRVIVWSKAPALARYLWLLPLSLWGAGSYQALNYWAVRKSEFTLIARTQVSQAISQVAAQVGLGMLRVGVIGLLVGDTLGRTSGSGTLGGLVWHRTAPAIRSVSVSGMRRVARQYRRFPLLSGPSVLLNAIGLQLPTLLVAAFYGPTVTGWFALGQRVTLVPAILVGRAVAQVYFGEASRLARECPAALRHLFFKTALGLLAIGVVPMTLLAIRGPWLFATLFGRSWHSSGMYVGILMPMAMLQLVCFPLGGSLDAVKRQDLHLLRELARVVSMSVAVLWAGSSHLSATTTVAIVSVVGSLGYVGHITASWLAVSRFIAQVNAEHAGTSKPGPDSGRRAAPARSAISEHGLR